jgi:hypothetical protein
MLILSAVTTKSLLLMVKLITSLYFRRARISLTDEKLLLLKLKIFMSVKRFIIII